MRIIILTAFFVSALAANDKTRVKSTVVAEDKSQELKEESLQSVPTSYDFKYSTGQEGPAQLFREEHRDHDGTVRGKYGYVDPNGKLRIINYKAGARGYSASGDIGPDSVAQNQAQLSQSNDPSVRAQVDAWSRAQPGQPNFGSNNWNSPPVGWSSVDPLWNVGALPQQPQAAPAYDTPPASPIDPWARPKSPPVPNQLTKRPQRPASAVTVPQSQVVYTTDQDRHRNDGNTQNRWDNSDSDNNWQRNQPRVGGSVDWNTWNPDQQTWTKPSGVGGSGLHWTSRVDHQVANGQGSNPRSPSPQWQDQPSPALDQWTPPSQGPTQGQWSPAPQSPTAGQWTQFDDSPVSNDWGAQQQPALSSPQNQPSQPDLRQRWTGSAGDNQQNASIEPITGTHQWNPSVDQSDQWNRPLAGPPAQRPQVTRPLPPPPGAAQWSAQPAVPVVAPLNWNQGPPPPESIADQWAKRQGQVQVSPVQVGQQQGQAGRWQGSAGWQTAVQNQPNPAPQEWPLRVSRVGESVPPPVPTNPDNTVPKWSQPANNGPAQAQYMPALRNNQVANQASGQQWPNPPLFGGEPFSGPGFVHFRIDHTVDGNQPPLRYQYSY